MSAYRVSRRALLGAGAALGVAVAASSGTASAAEAVVLKPPKLKPGDRVRIVSPGSTPVQAQVERGIEVLSSWGLVVEVAPHVYDKVSYLAGTDADRLSDLNAALSTPSVRAVIASRGGAGTQRIVAGVDFNAVLRDPKPVVGFSDLTILQAALWRACRLATVHGPMAAWSDARTGPESAEALRSSLMTTAPVVVRSVAAEETAAVSVPGRAVGTLLGGNLSLVQASVGTRELPSLRGAILLIEEVGEPPYHVDRMLTQLRLGGHLAGLAGVAVGQFVNCVGKVGEWTIVDLLRDRLYDLGVPVLGGLPIGHGNGQLTVPLGTPATLDATAGTLTVEAAVR